MRPGPEVLIEFHERAPRTGLPEVQRHDQRGVVRIPVSGHRDTLYVAGAQEVAAESVTMLYGLRGRTQANVACPGTNKHRVLAAGCRPQQRTDY
jgi:hypothetical protein